MKKFFSIAFGTAILVLFAWSAKSLAQTPDTVWVMASPEGNITNFINGDTTKTGQRNNPNRVYMLYDDSVYYYSGGTYNGVVVSGYNLNISAPVPAQGHFPPEINPMIHTDGSITYHFVEAYQGSVTLKNLYIQGIRPDQGIGGSYAIQLSGDTNSVVTIDNCVFDGWYFRAIGGAGTHNKYFVTNSKFINDQYPTGQFDGQEWGILSGATADTVSFVNNTFFCNNSYILLLSGTAYAKYLKFDHNTVFLTVINPLWLFQAVNADIENNILYGTMSGGELPAETAGGWYETDGQHSSTISLDTLSTVGSKYGITEADRHINVLNNAYFWPSGVTDWWTKWNDSVSAAGADSEIITPPTWMNTRTQGMFADKKTWPNLNAANNDSVDPGFPASAMGQVDKLVNYLELDRTNQLATYDWWYVPAGQDGLFPGAWPIPWSLAYSNAALQHAGTDGKALGDLNWFPDQLTTGVTQIPNSVPSKFELSQNYPNPFNPTTMINYNIPKSGLVSLKVYNVLGQEVATIYQGFLKAGSYKADFDASNLASGVYLYRLESNGLSLTKKFVLLK